MNLTPVPSALIALDDELSDDELEMVVGGLERAFALPPEPDHSAPRPAPSALAAQIGIPFRGIVSPEPAVQVALQY
jgi:hypothetical protein